MKNQNPDFTTTPPEVIEHKGRIAKIYRAKNRDRFRYEVKYRDPNGEWKRETFDEPDAARKHANHVVKQLDAASQPFLMLRGKERFIYERALDLLRPTGQPLDMAVAELVEAKSKLKDVCTLREAVETTRNLRAKPVSTVTVQQVVDDFLKVKDTEGLSPLYRRDLRNRLGRFGADVS
jgi:hypothetical protein